MMFGRSIGATCAVHLAAKQSRKVHGLIVDSGLMSIKQLPTVQMLLALRLVLDRLVYVQNQCVITIV